MRRERDDFDTAYDDWVVSVLDDEREAREDHCPQCGAEELHMMRYGVGECSAGCETSVRHCAVCGWQGEPT